MKEMLDYILEQLKQFGCEYVDSLGIRKWFKNKGITSSISQLPNGQYYYVIRTDFPNIKIKNSVYSYSTMEECEKYCILDMINHFEH